MNLAKIAIGGTLFLMGGSNIAYLHNQRKDYLNLQIKTQELLEKFQEKNQRGKIRDYAISFSMVEEIDKKTGNSVIENAKNAMFEAGAGYAGKNKEGEWLYSNCSNQNEVEGQYVSLPDSKPHIETSSKGKKETVNEVQVRMDCNSCDYQKLIEVITNLVNSQKYQVLSYQIFKKVGIDIQKKDIKENKIL